MPTLSSDFEQRGCGTPPCSPATAWAPGGISRSRSSPAATRAGSKRAWSLPWSRISITGTSRTCSSSARMVPSSCPTNSIRTRSSAADESTAQADGGVSNGPCRRHQVSQKDAFIGGRPFLIDANVSGAILNRWDAEPLLDDIAVAYVAEPPVGTNVRRLALGQHLPLGHGAHQRMVRRALHGRLIPARLRPGSGDLEDASERGMIALDRGEKASEVPLDGRNGLTWNGAELQGHLAFAARSAPVT